MLANENHYHYMAAVIFNYFMLVALTINRKEIEKVTDSEKEQNEILSKFDLQSEVDKSAMLKILKDYKLRDGNTLKESFIIASCNRSVLVINDDKLTKRDVKNIYKLFCEYKGVEPEEHKNVFKVIPNKAAVKHIFRIATGLEARVLGEPHILDQINSAVRFAGSTGNLDGNGTLNILTAYLNKRVIPEVDKTDFRTGPGSEAQTVFDIFREYMPRKAGPRSLAPDTFMVIAGTGEYVLNIAKKLMGLPYFSANPDKILIQSSDPERAAEAAKKLGVGVSPHSDVIEAVKGARFVVIGKKVKEPIITQEHVGIGGVLARQHTAYADVSQPPACSMSKFEGDLYDLGYITEKTNDSLAYKRDLEPKISELVKALANEFSTNAKKVEDVQVIKKNEELLIVPKIVHGTEFYPKKVITNTFCTSMSSNCSLAAYVADVTEKSVSMAMY